MKLKNITISDEEVLLAAGETHVLGPALRIEQCQVIASCDAQELVIAGVTMTGGSYIQASPLSNFHFEHVHFNGVRFTGSYIGCDFGNWESTEKISVENCDFTDAVLDGCRFINSNPETIKFPKWPCFAIVNPSSAAEYVSSRTWPARIATLMNIYTDSDPECVVVCGNAERIAHKNGLPLPNLRELLQPIPGIKIND